MKTIMLAAAILLASAAHVMPAAAADSMAMGGMMAKCSPKNPAVIVNTTKMTYMMDTKSNRMAMKGMMDHDKMVCQSTAMKMGAKMKPSSSMMMAHPKM